jgi:hypothetical protein
MPDEPSPKLFSDHRFARQRKFPRPLAIYPDAIAAEARKRQIKQFDLETLSGLVISEQKRIVGLGV